MISPNQQFVYSFLTIIGKGKIQITEGVANSVVANATALGSHFNDSVSRPKTGEPMVRTVLFAEGNVNKSCEVEYVNLKKNSVKTFSLSLNNSVYVADQVELESGPFRLRVKGGKDIVPNIEFKLGGVYTIIGHLSEAAASAKVVTITKPNSVHILWQVPQYIVMTMAEVMFSVTGLEFAFTQAPETMKSLLQASWLLTVAVGNLVVVIFSEINFGRQVNHFFLFFKYFYLLLVY